jgi:ATP-dependent DNA ligase
MYRSNNGYYKINGRSKDLLKLKKWQDAEFQIVNASKDKLGECVFECVTKDGQTFSVKMEGTHEERMAMWINSPDYIDSMSMLTVKFFELTKDGSEKTIVCIWAKCSQT